MRRLDAPVFIPGSPRSPEYIRGFAYLFVEAQNRRDDADYDPAGEWFKSEIQDRIETARAAIQDFEAAELKEQRAFAVHVFFGTPTT